MDFYLLLRIGETSLIRIKHEWPCPDSPGFLVNGLRCLGIGLHATGNRQFSTATPAGVGGSHHVFEEQFKRVFLAWAAE